MKLTYLCRGWYKKTVFQIAFILGQLTQRDSAFKQILTITQYQHYQEMVERLAANAEKRRPIRKN